MAATKRKVLVIGGAGQAGRIHVKNLAELEVEIGCFDFFANETATKNYDARETSYAEALLDNYNVVVIALPDNILFRETSKVFDAIQNENLNLDAVLVEKPGSMKSEQLRELCERAEDLNLRFFINYQRSFDPRLKELTERIGKLVKEEGYDLDYVSIHSSDKAQPPQAAHQALNQGCHDYAMLLDLFQKCGITFQKKSMNAIGGRWGAIDDTKFLKVSGLGLSANQKSTIFDVKMSRVSAFGTHTRFEAHLSKHGDGSSKHGMYCPENLVLQFPEKADPDASWADTWSQSFKQSMRSLVAVGTEKEEPSPVPVKFGVDVLEFAESIIQCLETA